METQQMDFGLLLKAERTDMSLIRGKWVQNEPYKSKAPHKPTPD